MFLVAISLSYYNGFGQDTLTKYLIIDTVKVDPAFVGTNSTVERFVTCRDHKPSQDYYYELSDRYPNFICSIKYTKGDSLDVGILIDDKGSEVHLNHFEQLTDTILIDKWLLFHNKLPDSIRTWVGYYHYRDDSSLGCYKQREKVLLTNSNVIEPAAYGFTLNHVFFPITLRIVEHKNSVVSWYHGYASSRDQKKVENYKYGLKHEHRNYNKFAGSVNKLVERTFTAEIDLKKIQ